MISIRRYRPDDIDALYEAALESVAQISPWMSWLDEGYTREMAEQWVLSRNESWERNVSFDFVIEDESRPFLGTIGLNAIDVPGRRANFGYWIRTSAAGKGVATTAGRMLIELAFAEVTPLPVRLHRLEIVVAVDNLRSHRVARKLGGVREGVARARLWPCGAPQDAVIYSVLRIDTR